MRSWTKRDAKMAEFGHAILVKYFFYGQKDFLFWGTTSVIE